MTLDGDRIILEAVNRQGYTREFVEMFLKGDPDPVLPEREQPPPQERDFDL